MDCSIESRELLNHVDTLFFGDSYARLLVPPPRSMHVVSYPGIPLQSINQSMTKETEEVDMGKMDWIDTHTLTHEAKKKKVFLTFASQLSVCRSTYKKMIHQMLRFPTSKLKTLVFWMGNEELHHTLYHDLFKDFPKDPDAYRCFVDTYLKKSVAAYLRFLQTVATLEPTSKIAVILLHYSPVEAREMETIVSVKKRRLYPREMVNFILDNATRFHLVDAFNTFLVNAIRSKFTPQRLFFLDVNPLIFNPKTRKVDPEFVLHPKDIHLADPHRKLYRYLVRALGL